MKVVEGERVDMAIIDLKMPGMDGMELLGRIKDHSSDITVVVITGYADVENTAKALKAGASDFLPKPFGAQEIFHSVSRLIELKKVREENKKVLPFFSFSMAAEIPSQTEHINGVIHYVTGNLKDLALCEELHMSNINIALYEALINAILHGNLEISSSLREQEDTTYLGLMEDRKGHEPYRDRQVHITAKESPTEVVYVVQDEGPGFDPTTLPDPTDPGNLEKISGRGILLIRTFMDEVYHNSSGNEITMIKRRDL